MKCLVIVGVFSGFGVKGTNIGQRTGARGTPKSHQLVLIVSDTF